MPGDTLIIYSIGLGPVTPDSPAGVLETQANTLSGNFQMFFGGVQATIAYAGLADGFMGLYQLNVVVPNVPAGDTVPVTTTLNGVPGAQTLITSIGSN
jgi:uncharacterized protein (TIGR03437 family)